MELLRIKLMAVEAAESFGYLRSVVLFLVHIAEEEQTAFSGTTGISGLAVVGPFEVERIDHRHRDSHRVPAFRHGCEVVRV